MYKTSALDYLPTTQKILPKTMIDFRPRQEEKVVGMDKVAVGHDQCDAITEIPLDSCEESTGKFTLQL